MGVGFFGTTDAKRNGHEVRSWGLQQSVQTRVVQLRNAYEIVNEDLNVRDILIQRIQKCQGKC
jgi:hypothetical protein